MCVYTCVYIYIYIYIHICICIYIYIYTHTHKCVRPANLRRVEQQAGESPTSDITNQTQ